MKKLLLAALAVGTAITTAMPAEARQGCGPRFHRGAYGRCVPNRVRRVVVVPAPRVGVYYPGRGYLACQPLLGASLSLAWRLAVSLIDGVRERHAPGP